MTERHQRKLAAIMFSDMVGYTALMQEDEVKARTFRDRCRAALKELVVKHDGTVLQFYGDGVLCSFASAIEATKCAIELQQKLQQEPRVPVRVGIHVGDVVFEDEGVYGDGVNVASRIEQLAAPGGICISEKVYDEVKNQHGMETISLGRVQLKNVKRPMEIFALAGEGLAIPERFPTDEKILTQIQRDLESEKADERLMKKGVPLSNVAVLPFVNISPDPENEYFSDGITEELINMLTKVEGLRVASRTSAFVFKGKNLDIRAIGDQLNVGSVVEGSVRKAGAKLRVTAQLINVADGYHLWSETFERDLKDVFVIQDEISQTIADTLKVKLVGKPNGPRPKCYTCNVEAYRSYLKGRFYWNKWTEEGWKKAIEYFQRAIDTDPSYAPAYAGLSDSYTLLGTYNVLPPNEVFPRAKAAATKAREIDDNLAEAHASLGITALFYEWDWSAAEREFKRAIELNPRYATAHHGYGVYLTAMGRHDQAIVEMKRAQELDPLSLPVNAFVGWAYFFARRYKEAIEQFQKTLEMDSNFALAHWALAAAYLRKSMFEEANAEIQKAASLTRSTCDEIVVSALIHAGLGNKDEARKSVDEMQQRLKLQYVPASFLALAYAALGDKDRAFELLEKAYEERSSDLAFLKVHAGWDNLRTDPKFTALLNKMGLEK